MADRFVERCEHFGTEHAEEGGQCLLPCTHTGPHRFEGAPPTPASPPGEAAATEQGEAHLVDRADGVRGHFCVGRIIDGTRWCWTPKGWAAAGTLFTAQDQAEAVIAALAELQREREASVALGSSLDRAYVSHAKLAERAIAAEQRLREVEGALMEIREATKTSGYGPGWTAFKIANHTLSSETGETGSEMGAENPDGGEGKGQP